MNPILLILDLDETLVFGTENKLDRDEDFKVFDYFVYKRPFLDDFLREMSRHFLLAVWSSASDDYVEEVAINIIPDDIELQFVWGRSRCTYKRNFQIDQYGYYEEGRSHYHYIKPLKKVKKLGFKLERMLIVDDTPHKSKDNYGNAVYPSVYIGDLDDKELQKLAAYLLKLKDVANVRRIEKRNWRVQVG